MAMVGVVSGSLYRRTHSRSRLAWSWVGGRLAPFYIHQMNRVNSRNGSAMMIDSTINIVVLIIIIIINEAKFSIQIIFHRLFVIRRLCMYMALSLTNSYTGVSMHVRLLQKRG